MKLPGGRLASCIRNYTLFMPPELSFDPAVCVSGVGQFERGQMEQRRFELVERPEGRARGA